MLNNTNVIYFCTVISNYDESGGMRIKVRVPTVDNDNDPIDKLPYVFPLLPKMFHVVPKVGELVLIFLQSAGEGNGQRFYIGPIISQPQRMDKDLSTTTAKSLMIGNTTQKPLPNPSLNPDNEGTLPKDEDVAIEGRKNTDIILKENEMLMRCGYKKYPDGDVVNCLNYNDVDQAYIQLKYDNTMSEKAPSEESATSIGDYKSQRNQGRKFSSIANVVADRINLLSYDSSSYVNLLKTKDRNDILNPNVLQEIFEKAHQLPYGDVLVEFLRLFMNLFFTHTHPFCMDSPTITPEQKEDLNTLLNGMLSDAVRIN